MQRPTDSSTAGKTPTAKTEKDVKNERLAEKLRQNLLRRKAASADKKGA